MKGKRYLAKNIAFLTVGQFGTKLLVFFLVPLYTSVLTSAEYGTYDLYSATVGLFVAAGQFGAIMLVFFGAQDL